MCDNGGFLSFDGVMTESALQRCVEFAPYIEGFAWRADKRRANRDEFEIYAALDHLFRATTLASSRDVTPVGEEQPIGPAPRGDKRMRPWLSMEDAELPPSHPQMGEKGIYMALRGYALGKWDVFKGGIGIYTKVAGGTGSS